MSTGPLQQTVPQADPDAIESLVARCAQLRLPVWWFDASGTLVLEPGAASPGGRWFAAPAIREFVAGAARPLLAAKPEADEAPTWVELFPGCGVVLLSQRQGRRATGVLAAMIIQTAALQTEPFLQACRSAGLDPEAMRAEIGAIAARGPAESARLRDALRWMAADLASLTRGTRSIREFGVQLSEMYEEIGLLYRLGRSMNRLTNPEEFVTITCDELAQTLPFEWVAVKFGRMAQVVPALSGRLYVAGVLPCEAKPFDAQAAALLRYLDAERWRLLPEGEGTGAAMAALVGGTVLAHPVSRDGLVVGMILAGGKRGPDPEITSFETQLLDAAAGYLSVFVENAGLYADQHALFMGTLQSLTAAIDAKDRYTCGHSERVAHLAHELALAAGYGQEFASCVRISGLLHDVGKIGVPEAVLTKPGRLTEEEFHLIKLHPTIGHRILKDIPQLHEALPGVLHHHERWDGRGYPSALVAEQIPLIARILAVADAFDAMCSTRSYRSAMPRERALGEIAAAAGTQLDPDLARIFATIDLTEYDRLVKRHRAVLRLVA